MDSLSLWFGLAVVFAATNSWLAITLWHTRKRAVRAEQLFDKLMDERGAPARVSPPEHALDAIAETVERIAEGQRFLTRALAEHAPSSESPVRAVPRTITPH
jgi:hypothetical protein